MHTIRLIVLLALLGGCRPAPTRSGALPHEAYVWQRAWTPEVRTAIETARNKVESLTVFCGEISVAGAEPRIVRSAIDYPTLKSPGGPVALALRIDPFGGPFAEHDKRIEAIAALARERVAEARANGVEPVEMQIDFDCAESKLAGYRLWLQTLRETLHPLPLCPTTLPSWLKQREFSTLVRESGHFILQVHCVEPPRNHDSMGKLTDPERAVAWVEQAGRLGVPFRVALPTYTYFVAFDSEGKARGVSAEGPSAQWSSSFQIERWEANPTEIAQLVAQWTRARPASMTGIIWYRLPVGTDTLNWRWPTLSAVMQGRAPRSQLRVEAMANQPSDIVVINDGERDEPFPSRVEASWSGERLVAADALAGYQLEPANGDANRVVFVRTGNAALSLLPPGARRPIGWIRCEHATPIAISVDAVASGGATFSSGNLRGSPSDRH